MNTTIQYVAACVLLAALVGGCGGGGGGEAPPPVQGPSNGAIQVLNNTGMDLASVAVYYPGGAQVDATGGGLALGATYLFADLQPGVYDVVAVPPGSGVVQVIRYSDTVVLAGELTDVTLTP